MGRSFGMKGGEWEGPLALREANGTFLMQGGEWEVPLAHRKFRGHERKHIGSSFGVEGRYCQSNIHNFVTAKNLLQV